MIVVKGDHVAFVLAGENKRGSARATSDDRPTLFARATHGLMRDPDGSDWPKCSALVGPYKRSGPVIENRYARRWLGKGVETREGRLSLPPRAPGAWQTVGEVLVLYYLRPGTSHPGLYRHRFNGSLFDRLVFGTQKVVLRKHGPFYRIDMGASCTIDDRGFVRP